MSFPHPSCCLLLSRHAAGQVVRRAGWGARQQRARSARREQPALAVDLPLPAPCPPLLWSADPVKRISLQEIAKHPWFVEGTAGSQNSLLSFNDVLVANSLENCPPPEVRPAPRLWAGPAQCPCAPVQPWHPPGDLC